MNTRIVTTALLFLITGLFSVSSPASERSDWRDAKRQGTASALIEFASMYPDSKRTPDALAQAEILTVRETNAALVQLKTMLAWESGRRKREKIDDWIDEHGSSTHEKLIDALYSIFDSGSGDFNYVIEHAGKAIMKHGPEQTPRLARSFGRWYKKAESWDGDDRRDIDDIDDLVKEWNGEENALLKYLISDLNAETPTIETADTLGLLFAIGRDAQDMASDLLGLFRLPQTRTTTVNLGDQGRQMSNDEGLQLVGLAGQMHYISGLRRVELTANGRVESDVVINLFDTELPVAAALLCRVFRYYAGPSEANWRTWLDSDRVGGDPSVEACLFP